MINEWSSVVTDDDKQNKDVLIAKECRKSKESGEKKKQNGTNTKYQKEVLNHEQNVGDHQQITYPVVLVFIFNVSL